MNRLMTKESRNECRKAWIQNKPTEIYKDIEILIYDHLSPINNAAGKVLVIWKGNSGKPYINYYFKTHLEHIETYIKQAKESADAREQYRNEQKVKGRVLTQSAQTALLIRKILKKEYPMVKFSVTSDNFANGNSVDVRWEDGIPSSKLESFLRQFEYGSFDGMTDSYNYDNHKEHPQAKYVMSQRSLSYEKRKIIKTQLAQFMNIEDSDNATIPEQYLINLWGYRNCGVLSDVIYMLSKDYDFTKGFTGVRRKVEDGREIQNVFELY